MTDAPILLISITLIAGIAIGWRVGSRRLKSTLRQTLVDRNEVSVKLLESRQNEKKLAKHIDSLSGNKQSVENLHKYLNLGKEKVEQQNLNVDALDEIHLLKSANLIPGLNEAQMPSKATARQRPFKPLRTASTEAERCSAQEISPHLRSRSKVAGIQELNQLAALSTKDINQLDRNTSPGPTK